MRRALLAFAMAGLLAGCGGGGSGSASVPPPSPAASARAASGGSGVSADACTAVSQSKVSAAAGFSFLTSVATSVNGGSAPASICQYVGSTGQSLSVDRFGAGTSFDEVAQTQFGTASVSSVSGVGDRARFLFTTTGGQPDAELLASQGSKVVLVILFEQGLDPGKAQQVCAAVANLELAT